MIKITLTTLVLLTSALSNASQLQELKAPNELINTQSIEVNGQNYKKIIATVTGSQLATKAELFAGDKVAKGLFNNVSKATGTVFVSLNKHVDAKKLAEDLDLKLIFVNDKRAVLKADADTNLLTLSDELNNDSRVNAVKIELSNNKNKPE